jgi:hypothetical protein
MIQDYHLDINNATQVMNCKVIFIGMSIFIAYSGGYASEKSKIGSNVSTLKLLVRVAKETFHVGEKLMVDIGLTNTGTEPIEVISSDSELQLSFTLQPKNTSIPALELSELRMIAAQHPEETPYKIPPKMTMLPGKSVERYSADLMALAAGSIPVGEYEVVAHYPGKIAIDSPSVSIEVIAAHSK